MAESSERDRYLYISAGEATEGPYDVPALRAQAAAGRLDARYQVWLDDAQTWAPFSTLEALLKDGGVAATGKKTPVRSPRHGSNPGADRPAEKTLLSENAGAPPEPGAPLKTMVPRHMPINRQGGGTYVYEEEERAVAEVVDGPPQPPTEAPRPARRRNYSPIAAGSNAPRPFAPAPPPSAEPAADEAGEEAEAPKAEHRPPAWPAAVICAGVCLLAILLLRAAGLVTFGVRQHEEYERMTGELASTKQKLADREAALRRLGLEKQDYLDRFTAAQAAVRNIRISVFSSTRRSLQMGDRPGVDQRLFELDQLDRLVPENAAEQKIRHELTDAFFSGAPASAPAR